MSKALCSLVRSPPARSRVRGLERGVDDLPALAVGVELDLPLEVAAGDLSRPVVVAVTGHGGLEQADGRDALGQRGPSRVHARLVDRRLEEPEQVAIADDR